MNKYLTREITAVDKTLSSERQRYIGESMLRQRVLCLYRVPRYMVWSWWWFVWGYTLFVLLYYDCILLDLWTTTWMHVDLRETPSCYEIIIILKCNFHINSEFQKEDKHKCTEQMIFIHRASICWEYFSLVVKIGCILQ